MRLETTENGATVYFMDGWFVSFQKNKASQTYEYSGYGQPGTEEDPDMVAAKIRQATRFLLSQQPSLAA